MIGRTAGLAVTALVVMVAGSVDGAPFTEGNLVVLQADDIHINYGDNAGKVTLLEFTATPGSPPVQALEMPTEPVGDQKRFTLPAGYYRAGHLTRSANGLFLAMGGFDAEVGMPNVLQEDPTVVNRVIGLVDAEGYIDTRTGLTDCFYGDKYSDFRMVATVDGTKFWLTGKAASSENATTRFAQYGATTSVRLDEDKKFKDPRCVNIFDGQLYVSANVSGSRGVSRFGTGLPETPVDRSEIVRIAASAEAPESASPYDFCFVDENTLYLADDRTEQAGPGGGLEKFVRDPGTGNWDYVYNLKQGLAIYPSMQLLRSVTGTKDALGNPVLYAITAEADAGGNRLVAVTDTGPDSEFITLQTAPPTSVFRGVEWTPRPCVGDECLGACCMPYGVCVDTDADSCDGVWMGLGSRCQDDICPLICSDPFADTDGDLDVDQADFGAWQACFTGQGGGVPEGCACFDRPEPGFPDGDIDVDLTDLDAFEACASGPAVPVDPACDDVLPP